MITVRITFLLALKIKPEANKSPKKSKQSDKKSKKSKKSPSSKKSSKSKSSKKKSKKTTTQNSKATLTNEQENLNYSTIEVSEPVNYVHIEYHLFPKKFKYAVDVVCWGPVAKIYATNGSKCLKTIMQEDVAWVPIFIEHYIDQLDTPNIRILLDHVIPFSITIGQNNVGKQAKNDKINTFYQLIDDKDSNFAEVYTTKPPSEEKEMMKDEIERIWKKLLLLPAKQEIVSWIYNIDEAHAFQISKILTKRFRGDEVYGMNCITENNEHDKKGKRGGKTPKSGSKTSKSKSNKTSKSSKSKKSKSSKSNKKSKSSKSSKGEDALTNSTMQFKIPASTLISDPLLATFPIKESSTKVTEAYVLLSSDSILTLAQKLELAPFVVKIRKINNLPSDILRRNGFEKIYVKCTIPGVAEFETISKPVSEIVRFNESRVICTNDILNIKILEILQTKRTFLEVFGVKDKPKTSTTPTESKKPKKKKSGKSKKSDKSKKSHKASKAEKPYESVILAMATYDLSSLAKSFFLFKQKQPCQNLSSIFTNYPYKFEEFFIDLSTVNEINSLEYPNKANPSPLKNDILILKNTTVKFEAHFLAPQYPSFHLKGITPAYKSFVVVVFNENVAKMLFGHIVLHNSQFEKTSAMLLPNLLSARKTRIDDASLSGFIIDDGNCFIFYVEGLSNGSILHLFHEISSYNYPLAKVFFNSEYLFEERRYATFFTRIGFLVVNLKIPLKDIFERQEIYVEGNVPSPCLLAIQKLHLILHSNTLKTILYHHLLPSELELVSLSLEFGVQVEFKGVPEEEQLQSVESSVIPPNRSKLF